MGIRGAGSPDWYPIQEQDSRRASEKGNPHQPYFAIHQAL